MANLLKTLLHDYGILDVPLSKLESERPGNCHTSLNAYYTQWAYPAWPLRMLLAFTGWGLSLLKALLLHRDKGIHFVRPMFQPLRHCHALPPHP